jgi:hypothetical protein
MFVKENAIELAERFNIGLRAMFTQKEVFL